MAGSEDKRSGATREKLKGGFKSLLTKSKKKSTVAGEQFSLTQRPIKPGAETPKAQSTSSIAQCTNLDPVNAPAVERPPEILPVSKFIQKAPELSVIETAPDNTRSEKANPDQHAKNSKDLPLCGAADKTSAPSPIISSQPTKSPKPICELWNEAYEDLKAKEGSLMNDYEAAMSKDIPTILGSSTLAIVAPQVAIMRKEQMAALVEMKSAEAKKNAWKLRYGDHEVLLKDLAGPVVNVIKDVESFVDGAVSANPYASIAWAGVSLLLPVSFGIKLSYLENFSS
jgi:hypothetical protein